MNLMVSAAVVVLAAAAFFFYHFFTFRNDLIHSLEAEAQIVADNSVTSLLFEDKRSGTSILRSLAKASDVRGAALVDASGAIFAQYGEPVPEASAGASIGARGPRRLWASMSQIVIVRQVVFDGHSIGSIYISAELHEIYTRIRQYVFIAILIWVLSMGAALIISGYARRVIATPIAALAETARVVSRDRDYSVRAAVPADNTEIAYLIDAFNTMLTQIEVRDVALNQARNQLELRVAERTVELQSANRELEAFSYTVAHDLRNPLSAISAISFLLTQSYSSNSDPHLKTILANLQSTTVRMGTLIDSLLNFSRASTAPVKSVPVNLSTMAHEVADGLRITYPGRNVEFSIEPTPEAHADPDLIRIVLVNLLGNAWKYTSHREKACIEFGAKVESVGAGESRVTYFVRDDGVGFAPELAGKLFQPFSRLHAKDDFPGTGIGLTTVQRILARHGGAVWAEGREGHGATFSFQLG